jgi:molybdopterin/thiamine biosynthesis adenylyltransferase
MPTVCTMNAEIEIVPEYFPGNFEVSIMYRPAVKRVHRPLIFPDRRIQLGMLQYGIASEIEDDEQGGFERLLWLLDGTRDLAGIWSDLRATHPDWELDEVSDAIAQLADAGHVEDLGAPLPAGLSDRDAKRYRSTRDFYSWIDPVPRSSPYAIQARIKSAKVTLLGLGGTGTAVAASLVASGIGALHCVDFDVVEETNLTRQLIYTETDIGRRKVDAAVARLHAMDSTVAITGQDLQVTSADDVERLMAGSDVFVLCADQPADKIQRWVNVAALRTSTPWYLAAYTGAMTGVMGFVPGRTGCWDCLNRRHTEDHLGAGARYLFDDQPHAVVAPSAAICGHLCALEVLYQLGGLPTQVSGRVFQLNLAKWDHQYFLDAELDPDCPSCGA